MAPVRPHLERLAAIDVGTNSVLMLIGERGPGGRLSPVSDRAAITRLGEELRASGDISPAAARRTLKVLSDFRRLASDSGVERVLAVGTHALRAAGNARWFLDRARDEAGVDIRVIPGEEEARLTYLGVLSGLPATTRDLLVFDIGGGSTETISGRGPRVHQRVSLEAGAVDLTERFLHTDPPTEEEVRRMLEHLVQDTLAGLQLDTEPESLVGVGGTLTTMAAVKLGLRRYEAHRVDATRLDRDELERQLSMYLQQPREQRDRIPGMEPGRADIMPAGASIVLAILRRLGHHDVIVSVRGLRHGLILEQWESSDPAGRPSSPA